MGIGPENHLYAVMVPFELDEDRGNQKLHFSS